MKLTGTNPSSGLICRPVMGSGKPAAEPWHASEEPNKRRSNPPRDWPVLAFCPCASMVWWLQRGAHTRSHPELGRENPQRRWYCVLRRGRVGRRQTFQAHGPRSGAKVRARKGSMVEHLAMTDESQGRPLPPFVSNPGAHPPPDPGGPRIAQGRPKDGMTRGGAVSPRRARGPQTSDGPKVRSRSTRNGTRTVPIVKELTRGGAVR